jgi:glycerol-3-phosphate cytidylyltransferase
MKTIITYGTFDLFHVGHLRLLERLKSLGDRLIVGVSTDEFNALKNKKSVVNFADRCEIVRAIHCVDTVIPEDTWEQKTADIVRLGVNVFGMGDDWMGHFDHLKSLCEVVYFPRTLGVSSTQLKQAIAKVQPELSSSSVSPLFIN